MSMMMKLWNNFNKTILQSPLHGLSSRNTVLVSFTGRKSGRTYTTPVNYVQEDDLLHITSSTDRQWWRNLKATPSVTLHLRGKAVPGEAQVFETLEAVADELDVYLTGYPQGARFFGVGKDEDGRFNRDDLLKASEGRVMIRIKI